MSLSKAICRRCCDEHAVSDPEIREWNANDEDNWRDGRVNCPIEGLLYSSVARPPSVACPYAAEHVVSQAGAKGLSKRVCKQCVEGAEGENWDDGCEARWNQGSVHCAACRTKRSFGQVVSIYEQVPEWCAYAAEHLVDADPVRQRDIDLLARVLTLLDAGISLDVFDTLKAGQLEDGTFAVVYADEEWSFDTAEEAAAKFIEVREAKQLGYDYERASRSVEIE